MKYSFPEIIECAKESKEKWHSNDNATVESIATSLIGERAYEIIHFNPYTAIKLLRELAWMVSDDDELSKEFFEKLNEYEPEIFEE